MSLRRCEHGGYDGCLFCREPPRLPSVQEQFLKVAEVEKLTWDEWRFLTGALETEVDRRPDHFYDRSAMEQEILRKLRPLSPK